MVEVIFLEANEIVVYAKRIFSRVKVIDAEVNVSFVEE